MQPTVAFSLPRLPLQELHHITGLNSAKLSFLRVCDLRHRLEELLGTDVDLVTTDGLRPEIRDEVMSEAIRAA